MKAHGTTLSPTRAAIILFCLWHMAAIALYALPDAARDPLTVSLRTTLQPIIRPYVLLFSQWQQWNLFSPDPLRRIVTYRVEIDRGDRWEPIRTIEPGVYSTFRHASEFKFLGRLLEGARTTFPLVARFLERQCGELDLATGSHVRLTYLVSVLPLSRESLSVEQWGHLSVPVEIIPGSETLCGWPAHAGTYRPFSP